MKKIILIVAGFIVFYAGVAEATSARPLPLAGKKRTMTQEQLKEDDGPIPPDALPQAHSAPPGSFSLEGDCSKEEGRALNEVDDRLYELSAPDTVNMNRDNRETMEMLRDPEQLRAMIELYTKCGRRPKMHELDRSADEQDMKDIEKANRQ